MANLTRAQRLKAIQEAYTTWEQRHERTVKPDPALVRETHTQYPEGIVAVSASPKMDTELIAMIGEAATYPTSSSTASAFHARGHHDQKTHGHRFPGGWDAIDLEQAKMLITQHHARLNEVMEPYGGVGELDDQLMEQATKGYTFYNSGDNLIGIHSSAKMDEEDVAKLMENVDGLQARFPIPGGANVTVDSFDAMNPPYWKEMGDPNFAETMKGSGMMRFTDTAFNGTASSLMTQTYRSGDPALSLLTHEWGHTQDKLGDPAFDKKKAELRTIEPGSSSLYALMGGPDEAFAEAFEDFNTTPSGGTHAWSSTQAYVDAFGWK